MEAATKMRTAISLSSPVGGLREVFAPFELLEVRSQRKTVFLAMGAYFLGKRHYDPWIGRFWEPDDPIFLGAARFAGTNPYAYCFNDPANYTDRTGHSPWSEFWDGVGNWFGDHWVELAIGAGAIAVGVITMGVGAAIGGATFAGVMATMGTATLQSIASTAVSAAVSGLVGTEW